MQLTTGQKGGCWGFVRLFTLTLVFLCAQSVPMFAQLGTSQIQGTVVDEQGGALPGVTVVVTNENTGVFRELTSGGDGSWVAAALPPGPYSIVATLAGFGTAERTNQVVAVGTTMTVDLTLRIGTLEETIEVTGEAPIVDLTSTEVGGNVGTAELSQLPSMNRNYFAAVALLPGVQFSPSTQMGNDTIVASGQATQNNNISVDGGYNVDDALGTSAGAQVRTAMESIQEFQVMTGMYDAEYGRSGGAVVNAVTKAGTNQFKGVVFGYMAHKNLTALDYFAKQGGLEKADIVKRDWGGVLGGPVVRNKAHFFVSLERQIDNPNRTRTFPTRPSLDFTVAEERSDWNTILRFDHQINSSNTWAIRHLRELAPQNPIVGTRQTLESTQDETDLDQTLVATLTSVIGNSKVNTFRMARTWEHWWHGNACARAQGTAGGWEGFVFGEETTGDQSLCPPQLDHPAFLAQASTEWQGPWDSNYQVENHLSWYVPDKMGNHDFKFGARYNNTYLRRHSGINANGTFTFRTDAAFDAANPSTYPERLTIRVPDPYDVAMIGHAIEFYGQDKWEIGSGTTLSVGVRYDLEITPISEAGNPLFAGGGTYPVDKNNFAPRLGITRRLDDEGRSLVRAGYGLFYNRTLLGAIDDTLEFPKFTPSVNVTIPNDSADPGPRNGRFPSDPFLLNNNGVTPIVDFAALRALYPSGAPLRNTGTVILDDPDRRQPYSHQMSVGYVREVMSGVALNVDYVRIMNRDMFFTYNLNPSSRANTTRFGAITRSDAFGLLGEPYNNRVWLFANTGSSNYNGLNLSLVKRYSNNWSGRVSYSISRSTGNANNQNADNFDQVGTNLNLDKAVGPTDNDRLHVLSLSSQVEVPRTGITLSSTLRYMSGSPFTIFNSAIDLDQNGELNDPSPAGTYSGTSEGALQGVQNDGGRMGARGPDYVQLDLRAGWRGRLPGDRVLELFLDAFNITNRANFNNPPGDERLTSTFLRPTQLRGGSGFPRQAQFGVRFEF